MSLAMLAADPAYADLSKADQRMLVERALRWAVDGGIPDFKLTPDPSQLIVADVNLPRGLTLRVPGRTVTLLSPASIHARADAQGDFLYFRIDRISGGAQHASLAIALLWAVSIHSTAHYLSGGGATLEFEKGNGTWRLLPVRERWMS
jgi:hypothetical protein